MKLRAIMAQMKDIKIQKGEEKRKYKKRTKRELKM